VSFPQSREEKKTYRRIKIGAVRTQRINSQYLLPERYSSEPVELFENKTTKTKMTPALMKLKELFVLNS